MKNLFTICLMAGVAALGCHKAGPRKTIVAGHIDHLELFRDQSTITLKVMDYGRGMVSYSGAIDKKGNFKITFNQYLPEDVMLTQDMWAPSAIVQAMIVHPGDSIHVNLDYKNITDVKFSGDAAETNTDLYTYNNENYSKADMPDSSNMPKNELAMRTYCQYIRTDLLDKRKDFIDKVVPDDEVKAWTLHDVQLRYYLTLTGMLNNPHNQQKGIIIRNNTVDFGEDVNEIYNTKLLNARGYVLLPALVASGRKELMTPQQRVQNKLAQIEKSNCNPLIKQLLTGSLFRFTIANKNIELVDQNRAAIDAQIKEPFIRQPLLQYYKEMKQDLADPDVTADNTALKSGKSMLDSIVLQNKGKVIYVDLWATWCGPCRAEMPNAEKLKQQYKGKNVKFAAICIGNTQNEWKSLVADLGLSPGQYYCDPAVAQQTILTPLHIRAFPHYLIIDKTGGLISNGDRFRPADPLTAKTIDKLLN
jgi:thiol-disulfide isomerase/thioredoxin